jgi:hypothetical protein
LRALPRADAEKAARALVEGEGGAGVDTPTLLSFLPDTLKVAELATVLAEFTEAKTEESNRQQKSFTGSRNGIQVARALQDQRSDNVCSLSSTELCERCKQHLLPESGIVYPCKHVLHFRCAEQIGKIIPRDPDEPPIDLTSDCPFCGFLSVRMIDVPLGIAPEGSAGDPWSTNVDELLARLDEPKWKLPLK